ncbi:ferritin [Blattabacterium cuenoti]|uniref:ferritin n=1 Tax=Blattabacterium cuenoti TaxID=1653831 RepID=UPI00163BCC34|nr:ferritin [Blattabacterium cuenoti]
MFSKKIQESLYKQLYRESESSELYLSMGSLVECKYGHLEGIYNFLYDHSDEERKHMLKIIRYINKRGVYSFLNFKENRVEKESTFFLKNESSLRDLFQILFEHEKKISKEINFLINLTLKEKDYFTYNFLQWFVEEQIEEESITKILLDKISFIGEDKIGLYLFDLDVRKIKIIK